MPRGRSTDYEWAKILYEKCMLDRDDADYYAGKFVRHDLSVSDIPELSQQVLREVGVQRMGHVMAILKHAKQMKHEVKPRGRNTRRARSVSRSSSSGRSSSRSPSPPARKPRSTKRKSSPIPDRRSTNKKSPAAASTRKRQPSPSSSEAASSSDSSRSPSPPPKKKKEQSTNAVVVPNKVAHIDRTTAKKPTAVVKKLDDEDLLAASIELPARFKSKQKQPTILKSAMSSGGPVISRDFKGNEELEKRYGGKDGKSDRRGSGGIIYVRPESLKKTVTKQTVVRTGVLKNSSRNQPKLRGAAMDDDDDDRRAETTSSVFKRLNVGGTRSSRSESSRGGDVRGGDKRERDSRDKSRENKKTINSDKVDIGGQLARRLSKASATSRRTSDGALEEIDHKETRTGKSEGLFANENDDFDKVLNAKRSENRSERSDLDHNWKKEQARRSSMQDRLGSNNERSNRTDRDRSDRDRSDKDRRNSSGSGIQARLGRSRKERSRSPVKSDIKNRLGNKRD